MPVRVSAISFLNPAPLLYNFEHEPVASELRTRYKVHYTTPAQCAAELHAGQADLGLIPIAELTPELAIVPGCTIASLDEVRSILLLVKAPSDATRDEALRSIRTIASDSASRSSAAYFKTLLRHFFQIDPPMREQAADPASMLAAHDAALLIGDPALLAREARAAIDDSFQKDTGRSLLWLDLASLWHELTGLPWVAAVWAVRPERLGGTNVDSRQLTQDLLASKDAGLAHVDELVAEWLPRLQLPEKVIRAYLTRNIYYQLDAPCLEAIRRFRSLAAETGVLPPLENLNML